MLGHGADEVRAWFSQASDVQFVVQEPQLGTGHALLQTRALLDGKAGRVLLLSGDVPLLTAASVRGLLDAQAAQRAAVVVATARVPNPTGYGRIVRDSGHLTRIVEHRDASEAERAIDEINSGVYVFELAPLFGALARVGSANAQGEYYLPDLVGIYAMDGRAVDAQVVADADEIRGINTRAELAEVGRLLQARTNQALMASGVTLVDPATAYIGPDVTIGQDSVIHPFVFLEGSTSIGANCEIHAGVRVVDCANRQQRQDPQPFRDRSSPLSERVPILGHLPDYGRSRPLASACTSATSSRSRSRRSAQAPKLVICPILAMPRLAPA